MRVLYDTNVLLDVLLERKPFYASAARTWTLAELGRLEGLAAAVSFTNAFYIISKVLARESARNAIKKMRGIFAPVTCDGWVINKAIDAELPDFEDAVQYFSALHAGADCILTRNAGDFPPQPVVPVFSPAEFLARTEKQ
jgi:predicted nucleic acid-binding protein